MTEPVPAEAPAPSRWLFASLALLVLVSLAGGGSASREAPLRLMAVELASLPALVLAALSFWRTRTGRTPAVFAAAIVLAPLIQLIPLPPALWQALPGRAAVASAAAVLGVGRPWLPASLAPFETWRSLLALIPPIAMAWGVWNLPADDRRRLVMLWMTGGLVSLGLGALQRLAPASSALWLYAPINPGSPVGLFANRNHQAAFLVALLPLAGALVAEAIRRRRWSAGAVLGPMVMGLAIIGLATIHSRAGVLLGVPALVGALAIAWRARGGGGGRGLAAGLVGLVAVVGVIGAVAGAGPMAERFAGGSEARFLNWPIVAHDAAAYAPLGAGPGTLETVYRASEPLSQLTQFTTNHADNDYLELWLECGVLGAALVVVFLVWWAPKAVRAWTAPSGPESDLARAAAVATALLLIHSAVDEPLRTTALSTLFAFLCATLAAGVSASRSPSA